MYVFGDVFVIYLFVLLSPWCSFFMICVVPHQCYAFYHDRLFMQTWTTRVVVLASLVVAALMSFFLPIRLCRWAARLCPCAFWCSFAPLFFPICAVLSGYVFISSMMRSHVFVPLSFLSCFWTSAYDWGCFGGFDVDVFFILLCYVPHTLRDWSYFDFLFVVCMAPVNSFILLRLNLIWCVDSWKSEQDAATWFSCFGFTRC